MIGILIVAHGSLADSLVECATHVLGQSPRGLATLDFIGHADPDERQKARKDLLGKMDTMGAAMASNPQVAAAEEARRSSRHRRSRS